MEQNLITTREAADILGRSVSSVQINVQLGRITPWMKMPGKRGAYLFQRDYIEALAKQTATEISA